MDIRQLHYFLVLCEEMNYTRASQRLFLSRQALRQSITALEAELCGPLFVSAHHKLSLTERGLSLQRHAAPVVEQFQQMQAALHAEIQSAQPVRIGISVSLVPDYLPGLETQLDKFRQQYPHIEMRFRLLENDAVADGVEQGELDACWCRAAIPSGRRSGCRFRPCGASGCCCPACGRICSAPCGMPAPGRALRPTRRSAPASIRRTIWSRSSSAPA